MLEIKNILTIVLNMMKKEEEDEEKLDLELNSMSDFCFWVELSFSPHPLVLFFFPC